MLGKWTADKYELSSGAILFREKKWGPSPKCSHCANPVKEPKEGGTYNTVARLFVWKFFVIMPAYKTVSGRMAKGRKISAKGAYCSVTCLLNNEPHFKKILR